MSVRPSNLPPVQDMPPPGGYPKVDLVRAVPSRGPKGWQIWAGAALMIAWGFNRVGKTNREAAVQKLEERKFRYAVVPFLQAEADQEYMEREEANLKEEAEIMKDVPGW
eukprot:CAMPEP_0194040014 /NCGR_PEP_ID=MMETSP0009_2-20130614/12077_1 /TAXON_ID=210454 /ORGANISM="Grammatophora oceanica, Strain CCMP 410" /LENGTH=108 /DNA_ID=CAMNT_0038683021 /DNA_START=79 /DNA_END=402 /DNA_ORIENTATION=-